MNSILKASLKIKYSAINPRKKVLSELLTQVAETKNPRSQYNLVNKKFDLFFLQNWEVIYSNFILMWRC